ncbi:hypothetical protein GE061_001998 [Apolygus lucorum]|uniref:Uncharacterized protein n=1 Tax=Apolygus lucorum TaxID=248454 RepID=A0A6A4JKA7_APOLU|nr:hypothetical protein GE061_001998 [Apolygus lucorum]
MERRSFKKKFMTDDDNLKALAQVEEGNDEGLSDMESSDDDDLRNGGDGNDVDPLDSIDLKDDGDHDFEPDLTSSSGSEIDVHHFDLNVEEEAIFINIRDSEVPDDQAASSSAQPRCSIDSAAVQ